MATLKQIADEVGVSVNTVSRALTGKTKGAWSSSAKRTEEIQKAAKRLGYRPNVAARAMRAKQTMQVGVLVRELSNPISIQQITAYNTYLERHGYKLVLGITGGEVSPSFAQDFSQAMIDGIINLDAQIDTPDLAQQVAPLPVVGPLRHDDYSPVRVDFHRAITLVMEHLWGLGHRRIGFLSGAPVHEDERLKGFEDFYKKQRKSRPDSELIAHGDWTRETGETLTPSLIQAGCTAIVAANDLMAVGAITAVKKLAKRVPEHFSIVGFDDSILATVVEPALTTIRLPVGQVAAVVCRSLIHQIEEGEDAKSTAKPITLTAELVIRQSTGPRPNPRKTKA